VAFEVYSSEGAAGMQQMIGSKFRMGAADIPAGPRSNVAGNAGDNILCSRALPLREAGSMDLHEMGYSTQVDGVVVGAS
jgi:hypothetical protein